MGGHLWTRARGFARQLKNRLEVWTLVVLLLITAAIWAFIELADEVVEGSTRAFDTTVLLALRTAADQSDPLGPGWVEELGRDFTALGGMGVLTAVTLAIAGFLHLQGKTRSTWLLLASVGTGILLSTVLKQSFDRPRPDLVPHESIVYTASFPSGHSMMAATTYLTVGVLVAEVERKRRVRIYLIGLVVLLTLAVGVSRVYLGVHWPTDVLAGWTSGAAWALLCWIAWLQIRGAVGPDVDEAPSSTVVV